MGASRNHAYARPEHKALTQMIYTDLKRACIIRGMNFQDVVEGDHGILATFFIKNFYEPQDSELLEDFDIWMDRQLEKNGLEKGDPLREFKLSSIVDPETEDVSIKRRKLGKGVTLPKKERKKKVRNSTFNVLKGTKKEFTMELTKKLFEKGKNMESKKLQLRLVSEVIKQYPDANEKSIKIWYKRALNGLTGKEKK